MASTDDPVVSPPELDEVDQTIVSALAVDCRLSHRELARRIGMAPGTVSQRVERLERLGVIAGYHAAISPEHLGLRTTALVGLQVTQGGSAEDTMARLLAVAEVRSVSLVTGQWDFVVELRVRDQDHLRAVLIDGIWQLPMFRHSETLMVLERRERPASWFAIRDGAEAPERPR